ncbi:hypothetical protein CBL_13594 [Carabus blaptoides fortunei]
MFVIYQCVARLRISVLSAHVCLASLSIAASYSFLYFATVVEEHPATSINIKARRSIRLYFKFLQSSTKTKHDSISF